MKVQLLGLGLVVALGFSAAALSPARADSPTYSSEAPAQHACGTDEVVWVNLDRHRFYHKDNAEYGKGSGVYTCAKGAAEHYREQK